MVSDTTPPSSLLGEDESPPPLPGPDEAPLPPWPGELVQVGPSEIFVRRAGRPGGEPAVFVHGLGGASTNWTDLMALLGDRLDGRALDLPGFGRSGPPADGDYSLAAHARSVVRYLEASGRGPVHLFGNSLGGAVCTLVAGRRPDLVRSLTLVSPAFPDLRPRWRSDPMLALLLLPGVAERVWRRLAARSPQERAQAILELCYYDPSRIQPQRVAEAAGEIERRTGLGWEGDAFLRSLRGLVGAYLRPGRNSLWRVAGRVAAPTLLLWGRHDRLVDVRVSVKAERTFPKARLVVFDDAGHVAQLERPRDTADEVVRHLDAVAAGSR